MCAVKLLFQSPRPALAAVTGMNKIFSCFYLYTYNIKYY